MYFNMLSQSETIYVVSVPTEWRSEGEESFNLLLKYLFALILLSVPHKGF